MPSNISSDIYYDQKSPTTNENQLHIIPNILNKSNNSNELDNLEPTLFIPSKVTDTSSNINNITCLEKYNGSRIYEYKDRESDIRSIDGTKRKNIGMRIRYEDSSDWRIHRCLMCCMETSNDVRKYVQSYNNTFS